MYRLVPHYMARPWGGQHFTTLFHRADVPEGTVGESWELADFDSHVSQTAEGETLGDLWRQGALGGSAQGRFPFLLKWLDAQAWLSVQVHPDERAALLLGTAPKSEGWYVVHASSEAQILWGFRDGVMQARVEAAYGTAEVASLMRVITPRSGMLINVPAGVVHAVGAGLVLLEVQQPSDATYRIHAWDRPDVALHLNEARSAIRWDQDIHAEVDVPVVRGPGFAMHRMTHDEVLAPHMLRVLACTSHHAQVQCGAQFIQLHMGDVVVMGKDDPPVTLNTGVVVSVGESVDTPHGRGYDAPR